ncbi:helix-turn-helix transcriptional regulator [Fusibacter ferrireducens]|uniref:Helix-turn-helix transcriptional regulator n=1 Tax=Fusibacter ferrireducens TaxID=2785058 RepID=A0ABR9ZS45_9FIRM|nr:helix-turn-helix domain-containing protein [Fusibacter ferrireducens]MBF4693260.1 helix-turn-helix transcriptional regulator [Fusibacter ferrireducens]
MKIHFYRHRPLGIEVIAIDESNEYYPGHNHISHYVIGLMLNGQVDFQKKQEVYTLGAGDTFVVEPNKWHSVRALTPFSLITFAIENTFFNTYSVEEAKKIILLMKQQPELCGRLSDVNLDLILNHIEAIYRLKKTNPATYKHRELDHVKALICENATETLSLDDLAKVAFLSKYHLIKKFSAEFGLTPHNLKIQRQIRLAQKQLLEQKSISEVAHNVGFFDQSHFTKHFKKILKLTPTDYKHAYIELEVIDSKPKQV